MKICNVLLSLSEPGYYEDGKFGIRIENVMLVKEVDLEVNTSLILFRYI